METSYEAKVWKIDVYKGARATTYRVRWVVAGRSWQESFRTHALADAFRSELLRAARRGEAFLVETGRPTSIDRAGRQINWLVFAREYAAMKWPHLAPNSRRNTARALTNATLAVITGDRGRPDDDDLRAALARWAFAVRSADDAPPDYVDRALAWLERNTRDVGELAKPAVARDVLDGLGTTKDGRSAAPSTVQRQRGVLVNLAEYAVERRLLAENPITALPRKAPKVAQAVDRRVVVNPGQARALLDAVAAETPSGDRLVSFFGAMYYAALRPAEALMLRKANLALPTEGWGELLLESSSPVAGPAWTDTGRRREERPLKHRARGETRVVPCPPALTALLHAHLESFGNGADGLLFRGIRGGEMSESTYCRVWRKARVAALTADEARSPLARRPYDLRHAAVSTWLNAGVPATQVATWAGHGVAVLLQIYAKCLVGQEDAARRRIDAVLGGS
jgi:site-specific recombinase XerD